MTTDKDFKRLVRGRMRKTGEAYTAARAHLLKQRQARPIAQAAPQYARLAGMSDAAIQAKTGCTWERWVKALDRVQAAEWTHRQIADYVHRHYRTSDWWAQAVTVGYERIRGLRAIGQRRDGSFEANRSKTVAAPVAALYRAFRGDRVRRTWLPSEGLAIRTATPNKSIRATWGDGTAVEAYFTAKGAGKSQVQVQHRKLPSREAATRMKQYWSERLDTLAQMLQ